MPARRPIIMAGEFGPSVADIARMLTLNPRHFGALAGLAMILEEIGKPRAGRWRSTARSLAIHPHQADMKQAIERLKRDAQGTGPLTTGPWPRMPSADHGGPWADEHRQDPLRHRADAGAPHRRHRPAAAAAGARGL